MKLQSFKPTLGSLDGRTARLPPKVAAPVYQSPEYRVWRDAVVARAGGRCEAVQDGRRCRKGEPHNRMFADHRAEVRDGGALYDVANGECLCGSHHGAKTARAKAARR